MAPQSTRPHSVARIHLVRALETARDEEKVYCGMKGFEAELALAARIVTLLEADVAEVEKTAARLTEDKLREAFAATVVESNTRLGQGFRHVTASLPQTFHVHGQELALIPDDEAQFEQALNVVHLEHKGRVR